jgi:hypothetical protein
MDMTSFHMVGKLNSKLTPCKNGPCPRSKVHLLCDGTGGRFSRVLGGFKGTSGQRLTMGGRSSVKLKIDPKTKLVELVEGYESWLRAIFDTGPRWPTKRKILSESRRCENRKGPKMLPGKYPTSAEGVVTHSLTPDSRSSHKTLLGSSDWVRHDTDVSDIPTETLQCLRRSPLSRLCLRQSL